MGLSFSPQSEFWQGIPHLQRTLGRI